VLSLLHEKTSSFTGDPTGQELCLYLTQKACVPYMEILGNWVYKGVICDPYQEVSCFSTKKLIPDPHKKLLCILKSAFFGINF
jgi:hypothetical protein